MPSELPFISVVTPSLNRRLFIAETIDSILSQDYPLVEYIVVDGGSTDGTLKILKRYDEKLKWISERDDGQSAAINKGWWLAQGEIVAFLNADDTYLPNAIEHVAKFFGDHPDIDIVYGDCDYMDERGHFLQRYPSCPFTYVAMVRSTLNYIPQPAAFIRRCVLESVGWLDDSLHCVMDFDYWLRAGIRHSFAYLPIRLARMRLHGGAKSLRHLGRFAAELTSIYHRLFTRDDLPAEVRAIEARAMSNIYYRAASCCYWSGQYRDARSYAIQGWYSDPSNIRPSLIVFLLGKAGRSIADRSQSNPYLLMTA